MGNEGLNCHDAAKAVGVKESIVADALGRRSNGKESTVRTKLAAIGRQFGPFTHSMAAKIKDAIERVECGDMSVEDLHALLLGIQSKYATSKRTVESAYMKFARQYGLSIQIPEK